MESLVSFLTSKLFLAFVLLVVVWNVARRYARRAHHREARSRQRLRSSIRQRASREDDEQA